jgi:hypothetical protein
LDLPETLVANLFFVVDWFLQEKRKELIQAINTQVKERELKFAQFFICPRKHMLFMQKLH